MTRVNAGVHVVAIDCCEHILAALGDLPSARLTATRSRGDTEIEESCDTPHLLAVGAARYPVRRLFISHLRRVYPEAPLLIFRREDADPPASVACIRGEFVLSDAVRAHDLEIVAALCDVLPLAPCEHAQKGGDYDTVREVVRVITERYTDPKLDLHHVARALPMSPARLSRVLNQQVGISFRQLLRHTRIEEAKRMLATRRYSVKEVAARVGFTDSHYFSRSFKQLTGGNASEYCSHNALFG